ncbi:hypothetical protein TNCV_3760131 [Trichonephila clavipes]|nr:hypothetical protein TNCV_3760131 [Trichonephila clavipes]
MAARVGHPCEGSEDTATHSHLVKSSSARLRHILLHTSVPFHEITPTKYPATERKDVTRQKYIHNSSKLLSLYVDYHVWLVTPIPSDQINKKGQKYNYPDYNIQIHHVGKKLTTETIIFNCKESADS